MPWERSLFNGVVLDYVHMHLQTRKLLFQRTRKERIDVEGVNKFLINIKETITYFTKK